MMDLTPYFRAFSITCCRMGFPATSKRGLGVVSVSGLNLVPNPPAKIMAVVITTTERQLCFLNSYGRKILFLTLHFNRSTKVCQQADKEKSAQQVSGNIPYIGNDPHHTVQIMSKSIGK